MVFVLMTSTHSEGDDLVEQHRRRHMEVKDEVLKQTHGMVFQLPPDSNMQAEINIHAQNIN